MMMQKNLEGTDLSTPRQGTVIPKGALRLGTQIEFRGNTTFVWRHWGCVTPQIIGSFKKSFENPDELDGFEELKAADKERVRKAWEDGNVADEDIPESAKKGTGDEEEEEEPKPKKKRAPPKKKAKKDDDDDEDDEKPKKKKAPAKKAPAKKKPTKKKKVR
ncbi:hypothetical protein JB92DRAFT_770195 [Gautieria morchelliformis]|nr:hypothetical protein JB92DRAFT_770195 [Gautieria morchelliformis]